MTKELYWRKDPLGRWHFHWGRTSRRDIIRSWFNWRPSQFNLGFSLGISPAGFNLELALWFNWSFTILFFVPKPAPSQDFDDTDLVD
jgi:hypothetical protein